MADNRPYAWGPVEFLYDPSRVRQVEMWFVPMGLPPGKTASQNRVTVLVARLDNGKEVPVSVISHPRNLTPKHAPLFWYEPLKAYHFTVECEIGHKLVGYIHDMNALDGGSESAKVKELKKEEEVPTNVELKKRDKAKKSKKKPE